MLIKFYHNLCAFIIIIVFSRTVQASVEINDLIVAESAKKVITGATVLEAGEKGAAIVGGKKLAKGAAVTKVIGKKKTAIKAGNVAKLGAFKKGGLKKGFAAKAGVKKVGTQGVGFDKSFAIGNKSLFGKTTTFGKKSNFVMGRSKGFAKSIGALGAGLKKKGVSVLGVKTGIKKIGKAGKIGLALGKIAKVGVMAKKAGVVGLKKGVTVADAKKSDRNKAG